MICPDCLHDLDASRYFVVRTKTTVEVKCGLCRASLCLDLTTSLNAQRFEPIVLWVSDTDPDRISVPPRTNLPVDPGYHKIEITNMRQADHWVRKLDRIALRDATDNRAAQKAYFDEVAADRRSSIRAKIRGNAKAEALFAMVTQWIDAKRARRYYGNIGNPNTHFQALSFDSSNRMSWADTDTGWKQRKA